MPAGSPVERRKRLTEATDPAAPVLIMVRTATATGSKLVATLHTTLDRSLADVRLQQVRIEPL